MVRLGASWIAFAITSAFFLYEFVARIEPSLSTEAIAGHFGFSNTGVGTLSSLFFWIYAPMQLLVGVLLDRYGVRRLIVPAIAICALGIAIFASSTSPVIAGIGRLLTGLGASFGFVGALYVVNHQYSPNRFALLSGLVNSIGMLGTAVGAVILSSAIETSGWRSVFLATAGVGGILFVLACIFLRNEPETRQELPTVSPSQDLAELVKNRRLWLISITGALYYMPVNVFGGLWGHSDLTVDHHLNAVNAETAVSMIFWGMAVGSVGAGAISDWVGKRKYLVISNATLAAMAYAAAIYIPTNSELFLASLLFLAGLFGGAQMLTFAMAKEGVSASVSGTTIAFVNMVSIASAVVFQPMVGAFLDISGGSYGVALATIPVSLILAASIMTLVSERRHADHIA